MTNERDPNEVLRCTWSQHLPSHPPPPSSYHCDHRHDEQQDKFTNWEPKHALPVSHFQTHDYHGSYCISLLFYKISPAESFWKISPCSGDLSLLPIFTKYKIINSDEKNASLVTPHLPLYLVNTAYLFISDHLPLRRTNYKTEFYENHSGAFMLEL